MSISVNRGFTDEPSEVDYFNIKKYIVGLSKFIKTCKTPMTISVQGAWGTGKTSMMKMIENELIGPSDESNEKYRTIWFNAWQFSQFNMEEDLAATMLTCLITKIGESDEKHTEQITKKLYKLTKMAAMGIINSKLGSDAKKIVEEATSKEEKPFNPIEVVDKLRVDFRKCVKEALDRDKKERLIFFIDDLDRIEPRKAVEMLEVLKLFFDCEDCVFLLAIDYEVVLKGVEEKYKGFSGNRKNVQKGKDFFDKIIQVPFKVPVANYDMTGYIQNCLRELGMECTDEEAVIYEKLVKTSIGTNPRTLKRMFNAFYLLNSMQEVDSDESNSTIGVNEVLLFAILCLQHYDDEIYNYVVCNSTVFLGEKLLEMLDDEEEMFSADINVEKFRELKPFFQQMFKLIGPKKEGYEKLLAVLQISAITGKTVSSKRAHRQDVNNIGELNFGDTSDKKERVETIIAFIKECGNDVAIEMFNQSSGKGVICGSINGKRFIESYPRNAKYRFEFILKSKGEELPENIEAMLRNEWKRTENRITCTINKNDSVAMEKAKDILDYVYKSWKK